MFRRIIVGIDGRSGGRDALALAALLGHPDARIVLANVHPGDARAGRMSNADYDAAATAAGLELLQAERAAAGLHGTELHAVGAPDAATGLHGLASDPAGDLIVVGASTRAGLGRLLLGDDTTKTLAGAPCPVAVAPAGFAERGGLLGSIGLGYDESEDAEAALELARELARDRMIPLTVLEAVGVASWLLEPGIAPEIAADAQRRRAGAQQRLAAISGVQARATVGLPVDELRTLAHEVDLLIVGSGRHGPIEGLLEGHTGRDLSHQLASPLLVVPSSARTALRPRAQG